MRVDASAGGRDSRLAKVGRAAALATEAVKGKAAAPPPPPKIVD